MDWTALGDVSWPLWRSILKDADSPILDDGQLPYEAAKPHSALCLAVMEQATRLGTSSRDCADDCNPFAFQLSGSFPGLMTFESWVDAIEHWKTSSLPHYYNLSESEIWYLAKRVDALLEQDRTGSIGLAVPDYLDEDGFPLDQTWLRYFGLDTVSWRTPDHFRVVAAWKEWCRAHGVFPSLWTYTPIAGVIEYAFSNGLRIYDDGTTARVVGNPQ